jgi:hypothetical protein
MPALQNLRPAAHLAADLETARAECERLADAFAGLSVLFAGASALVLFVGVWSVEPLFAASFGFALAAALAFAFGARAMSQAARAAPRIVPAPVLARVESRPNWRRAA